MFPAPYYIEGGSGNGEQTGTSTKTAPPPTGRGDTMADELTLDIYMANLTRRIDNLEVSLSDLKKTRMLFLEHPELFGEFKRMNRTY